MPKERLDYLFKRARVIKTCIGGIQLLCKEIKMLSAIKYQETSKFYEREFDGVIDTTVELINQYVYPVLQSTLRGAQMVSFTPEAIRNQIHRDRLFVNCILTEERFIRDGEQPV